MSDIGCLRLRFRNLTTYVDRTRGKGSHIADAAPCAVTRSIVLPYLQADVFDALELDPEETSATLLARGGGGGRMRSPCLHMGERDPSSVGVVAEYNLCRKCIVTHRGKLSMNKLHSCINTTLSHRTLCRPIYPARLPDLASQLPYCFAWPATFCAAGRTSFSVERPLIVFDPPVLCALRSPISSDRPVLYARRSIVASDTPVLCVLRSLISFDTPVLCALRALRSSDSQCSEHCGRFSNSARQCSAHCGLSSHPTASALRTAVSDLSSPTTRQCSAHCCRSSNPPRQCSAHCGLSAHLTRQ
jgi:hypothetical protein